MFQYFSIKRNNEMPGGWNQAWKEFFANNPGAAAKDVYQYLGQLMDRYGLSGLPIHPYGQ